MKLLALENKLKNTPTKFKGAGGGCLEIHSYDLSSVFWSRLCIMSLVHLYST